MGKKESIFDLLKRLDLGEKSLLDVITEIADLRREVEHLQSEIELITAPPEAVGNVILDLRRQLAECQEENGNMDSMYQDRLLDFEGRAHKAEGQLTELKVSFDRTIDREDKLQKQLAEVTAERDRLRESTQILLSEIYALTEDGTLNFELVKNHQAIKFAEAALRRE